MEIALVVAVVVVLAVVIFVVVRSRGGGERAAERAEVPLEPHEVDGKLVVPLDIEGADPNDEAVQRLVRDAAAQGLAARPHIQDVEVRDRAGEVLGTVSRQAAEAAGFDVPSHLYEPHAKRPGRGEPTSEGASGGAGTTARFETGAEGGPQRTLADQFELSEKVRSRIRSPDDTVDIVRAILEAAGVDVQVSGEVIRAGDSAVIVVGTRLGDPVRPDDLSQAFLRFQETRAKKGIVVTPGLVYPEEVRKRQAMAPNLRYVGAEGIQRMADAAAVGANPIQFAAPPVT